MAPEDRDQANAALLLNENINARVADALLTLLNENNTVSLNPNPGLPFPVTGDQLVHALMCHPQVKTTIYMLAAETARLLVKQAFAEYTQRMSIPVPMAYYTQPSAVHGYVFNADQLPKQSFF